MVDNECDRRDVSMSANLDTGSTINKQVADNAVKTDNIDGGAERRERPAEEFRREIPR